MYLFFSARLIVLYRYAITCVGSWPNYHSSDFDTSHESKDRDDEENLEVTSDQLQDVLNRSLKQV